MSSNLSAPQNLNGEKVLDAIAVQQGVLVERAEDTYSFSHLTLQEYLTAQYIVDYHRVEVLVEKCLFDRRWREFFLLISGLMRNGTDDLILKMEDQSKQFLNSSKLQFLFQWADQATKDSNTSIGYAKQRASAVCFALISINASMKDLVNVLSAPLDQSNDWSSAQTSSQELANIYALNNILAAAIRLYLALQNRHEDTYKFEDLVSMHRPRADIGISGRAFSRFQFNVGNLSKEIKRTNIVNLSNVNILDSRLITMQHEIPGKKASLSEHRAFIEKMWQEWFYVLGFNSNLDFTSLSKQEAEALNNYLYTSELMIRCKEAAVRVSADTWAGIEDRMLRVID